MRIRKRRSPSTEGGTASRRHADLDAIDFGAALSLALLPEQIRGFGHVKEESVVSAQVRWQALIKQLDAVPQRAGGVLS